MRLLRHITNFAVSFYYAKIDFISKSSVVYKFLVHGIGKNILHDSATDAIAALEKLFLIIFLAVLCFYFHTP